MRTVAVPQCTNTGGVACPTATRWDAFLGVMCWTGSVCCWMVDSVVVLMGDSPQVTPTWPVYAGESDTLVRDYTGRPAFARDAEQLAKDGWAVVRVHERRRRPGKMRFTVLRSLAWLIPPEPEIVVTYRRG